MNLLSKFYSVLARAITNVENEGYYNEPQETSEPVFWIVFGLALAIGIVSLYMITPLRRLLGFRS